MTGDGWVRRGEVGRRGEGVDGRQDLRGERGGGGGEGGVGGGGDGDVFDSISRRFLGIYFSVIASVLLLLGIVEWFVLSSVATFKRLRTAFTTIFQRVRTAFPSICE